MRTIHRAATALLLLSLATPGFAELAVSGDGATLTDNPLHLEVEVPDPDAATATPVRILVDGREVATRELGPGSHSLRLEEVDLPAGTYRVAVEAGEERAETEISTVPGWLSLLPPLLAIGLALAFKDVLISLYVGVFTGALVLAGGNPATAFTRSIDHFVRGALADPDHAAILIFSLLLGGMVGVISKSGGTRGIVAGLSRYATTARRGQIATWLMGIAVFFDDYANTLIVGPTMRPITDRLRISRAKLAYIVDSTAAPIAGLVPISTWVGYEIGLIGESLQQIGVDMNPYTTFLATIPYRFYPILALVMGFAVAAMARDFGPMLQAERRAAETGEVLGEGDVPLADYTSHELDPPEDIRPRALNAILPIVAVVVVTILGLVVTGWGAGVASGEQGARFLREVFANADSYASLLWASLAATLTAVLMAILQPGLRLAETMKGLVGGFKSMLMALVVLVLAWSLGGVTAELHTADYVVSLTHGVVSPFLIPVMIFVVAAAIAFATGTSWATMAILLPLVVPVIHKLALAAGHTVGDSTYTTLLLGTISSVLSGSVWGDHCSPISDTTILSSMASGCDHIRHVRTQLPYALGVGFLGMLVGDIPTAYGMSPWVSLAVGAAVIVAGVAWLGQPVDRSKPVRRRKKAEAA